ncbi:MAG: hypothetical protein Q9220_004238 [cf. Caloplaca sp. 1 TL-2023]
MACSIIPLLGRMAMVHVIMIWGTNNARTAGLGSHDIQHREIGSRLVLVSRILYAAFLWIAKFTISEFLKRLTSQVWRRKYEFGLQFIRWFLVVTFAAVVIATLVECQPFSHYWQVMPDPGAKCRQGYAQLITMGTSDVITDLLIVAFPIPIVLKSHMPAKRKLSLILLFSLSLILIGITIYRVVEVIHRHSDQQFRSLIASLEILAAAAISNALVLGSFVRDRGVKKQRYRFGSVGGNSSLDRAGTGVRPRTLTFQTWGSDADLAGDLGMRMAPELEKEQSGPTRPRPAPLALPPASHAKSLTPSIAQNGWKSPNYEAPNGDGSTLKRTLDPSNYNEKPALSPGGTETITPRRTSFFDVGGLLDHPGLSSSRPLSPEPAVPEITPAPLPAQPSAYRNTGRGSGFSPSDTRNPQPSPLSPQHSPPIRNFSRPTSPTLNHPQHTPRQLSQVFSAPSPASSGQAHHLRKSVPEAIPPSTGLRDVGGLLD